MNLAAVVVALYGIFCLIGGVIGYVKAKSKASLIAGTFAGAIMLISGHWVAKGNFAASLISIIVALLLGVRFFKTWRSNHRIMPDLLMVVMSLITLIGVSLSFFRS